MDFLSLAGSLLAVVLVLVLAYWASRFTGKTWVKASAGRNMKVIEQLRVGNDRQILLLKVQEQVYLIGVSQAGIRLLAQVEGEFAESPEQEGFGELLQQYISKYQKKEEKNHE